MTEESDVFNDSLGNEDCRGILLNCLKNLQKEVKYIRSLVDQHRQHRLKANSRSLIFQSQSNLLQISLTNMRKNVRKKMKLKKN